jgi:hypothetical protein
VGNAPARFVEKEVFMTDVPTDSPSAAPLFDDLVAKYSAVYGQSWANGPRDTQIKRLQEACAARNLTLLDGWLLNLRNRFLREVFTRITGIPLPKTQRGTREVLEEFVGRAAVEAHERAQEEARLTRAGERQEWARQWTLREVAQKRVRYQGEVMGTDAFIRLLVGEGFTRLSCRKRGAANEYVLCRPQEHSGYLFRRKCEHDYIVMLLEQREAEAARSPDPDTGPSAPSSYTQHVLIGWEV